MVTLIFAAGALVVFMDKASNDLIVEQRDIEARRLRIEAYSALEVTLAVLEEFRRLGNGLHSPAEGWSDPLAFASYVPGEDRTIEVAFEDESGLISLPRTNADGLGYLFKTWLLPDNDATALADALTGWMKREHLYSTGLYPSYEQSGIPYQEPHRSIRSFQELAAIDKVRELFFDEEGRPNELWHRFTASVSLLDFPRPNINGATPDTLAILGQFGPNAQQNIEEYRKGTGSFLSQGPGYFRNPSEAQVIAGAAGSTGGFTATISALRIKITVRDGRSQFRLTSVIAPPNGATIIQTNATAQRTEASAPTARNVATGSQNQRNSTASPANAPINRPTTGAAANAAQNLQYPFTLLDIRENDVPLAPPPPAPESR
ncbi:MAG: hypothetical protein RIQ93_1879 [Verrucomicrobiota bacterium]